MGGKEADLQHNHRQIAGFTLVELMVCLVLVGMISWLLFTHLDAQNRVYLAQDDIGEMQQNLRLAVQRISADLRMTGIGAPPWSIINGSDVSSWYNANNSWQPYLASANRLDVIGCLGEWGSLQSDATMGANTIRVKSGQGDKFPIGSDINVGGRESGKVTAIAGDLLTVDTDPAAEGNQTFQSAQPAGANVCRVLWVTYTVTKDNILRMNQNTRAGAQPVANNITALSIVPVAVKGICLDIILTGQASKKAATGGVPVTSTATSSVHLRAGAE